MVEAVSWYGHVWLPVLHWCLFIYLLTVWLEVIWWWSDCSRRVLSKKLEEQGR